jgi:hypothetical protein
VATQLCIVLRGCGAGAARVYKRKHVASPRHTACTVDYTAAQSALQAVLYSDSCRNLRSRLGRRAARRWRLTSSSTSEGMLASPPGASDAEAKRGAETGTRPPRCRPAAHLASAHGRLGLLHTLRPGGCCSGAAAGLASAHHLSPTAQSVAQTLHGWSAAADPTGCERRVIGCKIEVQGLR